MKRIDAAIAIVCRDQKILVCQRKDGDTLGGYWEFPGGKQEDGETLEQCLARELREELAIAARPIARLGTVEHTTRTSKSASTPSSAPTSPAKSSTSSVRPANGSTRSRCAIIASRRRMMR
jgi:8-oxo-dGTP pyrophosphatase MutT (NUDIX family)